MQIAVYKQRRGKKFFAPTVIFSHSTHFIQWEEPVAEELELGTEA